MDFLFKVMTYASLYFLGRTSYVWWQNKYLEGKRQDLIAYHAQLVEIEQALEEKDAHIRDKWQRMVNDISQYKAVIDPEDVGKWSEWDDAFFQSWKSAEK